ncbi:hypothetical protein LY76DRAFT_286991 [Colletotrichum caudatum]|nr:hypothetical protein LY76DRAFT_286991 [Colletotrichum caudatum]
MCQVSFIPCSSLKPESRAVQSDVPTNLRLNILASASISVYFLLNPYMGLRALCRPKT